MQTPVGPAQIRLSLSHWTSCLSLSEAEFMAIDNSTLLPSALKTGEYQSQVSSGKAALLQADILRISAFDGIASKDSTTAKRAKSTAWAVTIVSATEACVRSQCWHRVRPTRPLDVPSGECLGNLLVKAADTACECCDDRFAIKQVICPYVQERSSC
jgi:hypothetical protein